MLQHLYKSTGVSEDVREKKNTGARRHESIKDASWFLPSHPKLHI